jgi:hypothetical protein
VHVGYAGDELSKELASVTLFEVPMGKNMIEKFATCRTIRLVDSVETV